MNLHGVQLTARRFALKLNTLISQLPASVLYWRWLGVTYRGRIIAPRETHRLRHIFSRLSSLTTSIRLSPWF